jgi:hypothetical protein
MRSTVVAGVCALLSLSFAPASLAKEALRVDGATQETTDASLGEMSRNYGNRERCLFHVAIMRIAIGEKENRDKAGVPETAPSNLGQVLNGKTAKEIVALSKTYPDKITGICRN